jgi:hypothetical protein
LKNFLILTLFTFTKYLKINKKKRTKKEARLLPVPPPKKATRICTNKQLPTKQRTSERMNKRADDQATALLQKQ